MITYRIGNLTEVIAALKQCEAVLERLSEEDNTLNDNEHFVETIGYVADSSLLVCQLRTALWGDRWRELMR